MNQIAQFLKDYGELISITLIPVIIFYVGKKLQNREAQRKAKEELFLRLMANRKKYPPSPEMADCLNQIDVVFQDNKEIRSMWRAYYDSLHPDSQHKDNSNSFFLDLLSSIANDLGYKDLKQTELDRFYRPQYYDNVVQNQQTLYDELLRVLERSKSFSESLSDDDYKREIERKNK